MAILHMPKFVMNKIEKNQAIFSYYVIFSNEKFVVVILQII